MCDLTGDDPYAIRPVNHYVLIRRAFTHFNPRLRLARAALAPRVAGSRCEGFTHKVYSHTLWSNVSPSSSSRPQIITHAKRCARQNFPPTLKFPYVFFWTLVCRPPRDLAPRHSQQSGLARFGHRAEGPGFSLTLAQNRCKHASSTAESAVTAHIHASGLTLGASSMASEKKSKLGMVCPLSVMFA